MIKLKRAYEKPSRDDGSRVLVERLWPRGLTKERAAVDLWLKEVAPSQELRRWFGHDPGEVDSRLETMADWKEPYRQGVVYYLRDGRVRGVLLWNVWGQVDAAEKLIAEPGPFRPEGLKGRLPA
jgi:hypothetical protein